jgi:outer membrane protein TolC
MREWSIMTVHGRKVKKDREAIVGVLALSLVALVGLAVPVLAQSPEAGPVVLEKNPPREPFLTGPALVQAPPLAMRSPPPGPSDQVLPINLATALCLSQARPLVIALAQASVERAAAGLQGAQVLWLPDVHFAAAYSHHDGAEQGTDGTVTPVSFGSFYSGGGVTVDFGVTDAIFRPLAARQELLARQMDVQTAQNDALWAVAQGYFDAQEARGRLAGSLDCVAKAEELVKQVRSLSVGLVPLSEVDRAEALLADLNQHAIAARTTWRVVSARLTRALRLNPASLVVPLEPACLQVTLLSARCTVDDLIPCGLMNRPELASQKAVVQKTLELLRQEKLRPLLPSVVLAGCGPDGALTGGVFGGGTGGNLSTWGGRAEFDVGVVWTLQNLGLGNRALVRGRAADRDKAVIEFFDLQDRVAEEVAQADAEVEGARAKIPEADTEVRKASITFLGTVKGLRQIRGAGSQLQLVSRPQEAVAALQQLSQAYDQYYLAINQYNRAQFQLYHALGYPSRILAWQRPAGDVQDVDTSRPPEMAPTAAASSSPSAVNRR